MIGISATSGNDHRRPSRPVRIRARAIGYRAAAPCTALRNVTRSMASRVRAIMPTETGADRRSEAMIIFSSTEKRRSRAGRTGSCPACTGPACTGPACTGPACTGPVDRWGVDDPDRGYGIRLTSGSATGAGRHISRESILTPSFGSERRNVPTTHPTRPSFRPVRSVDEIRAGIVAKTSFIAGYVARTDHLRQTRNKSTGCGSSQVNR